jgi:hypothetical protein
LMFQPKRVGREIAKRHRCQIKMGNIKVLIE